MGRDDRRADCRQVRRHHGRAGHHRRAAQVIDFSLPYASTPAAFATASGSEAADAPGTGFDGDPGRRQKGGSEIDALRERFKGKSIGIMAATAYAKFIYDNFADVATVREYKTGPERDLDLSSGRIDVGFDDAVYFGSALRLGRRRADLHRPGDRRPDLGEGEALGLRKEDTDLRAMFDRAIRSALDDGTVKKLSLQFLKTDVSPH